MKINKKNIIVFFMSVWVIYSVAYIAVDIWNDFKTEQLDAALQSGYQQGVTDIVNQAIANAENTKCEPFSIFDKNKGKNVEIINVKCLTSATESAPTQK